MHAERRLVASWPRGRRGAASDHAGLLAAPRPRGQRPAPLARHHALAQSARTVVGATCCTRTRDGIRHGH
eukprot:939360-Prymnesium_polylepis.1